MQPFEDEIYQIVISVWSMLSSSTIERGTGNFDFSKKERTLSGCVQITGEWQGAVSINCSANLAKKIAASMFDTTLETITIEQIQDAIGEVANMVGGNIKSFLPGENNLSLPTVAEGVDYTFRVPGSSPINQMIFTCEDATILVSLLKKD